MNFEHPGHKYKLPISEAQQVIAMFNSSCRENTMKASLVLAPRGATSEVLPHNQWMLTGFVSRGYPEEPRQASRATKPSSADKPTQTPPRYCVRLGTLPLGVELAPHQCQRLQQGLKGAYGPQKQKWGPVPDFQIESGGYHRA